MKYQVKIEHKGETIEAKASEIVPGLYISDKPVLLMGYADGGHEFLSNKQVVCRIYKALLEEIRNTPKGYFKSLKFPELVEALKHIVATGEFLKQLRDLNTKYGYGNTKEKIGEEISKVIFDAINFKSYHSCARFSDPQNWVLKLVSQCHVGKTFDTYDLKNLYSPITEDDSKVEAKVKEFKAYPYKNFINDKGSKAILDSIDKSHAKVKASIEVFKKMRVVAGNDVVNWGPHKWASQVKKQGLHDAGYDAYTWLLKDVRDSLLNSGVEIAEKKESSVAKLKEKYSQWARQAFDAAKGAVTQDELVRLFKYAPEGQAKEYVSHMTPATAVSLLSIETKNVTEKLYDTYGYADRGTTSYNSNAALRAIINRVESGNNPKEFKALMDFTEAKGLTKDFTWKLFLNHVGEFYTTQFIDFARSTSSHLPDGMTHLPKQFFDAVVKAVPNKYTVSDLITDAFLRYEATDADKTVFLKGYHDDKSEFRINWELSHVHFNHLPYASIREFLTTMSLNNTYRSDKINHEWAYFGGLIIQNNDVPVAKAILLQGDFNDVSYPLFGLLNFNEKVEVLSESRNGCADIKKVIKPEEMKQFGLVALSKEGLCGYISDLPTKDLNENVKLADVTARVLEDTIYLPLNDKVVKALNKESAKRVIARARFLEQETYETISLKKTLYGKLNREELSELLGSFTAISEFTVLAALIDVMTPNEIAESCEKNNKFARLYFDRAPKEYLVKFKNKEAFKSLVGDRRNSANDNIGIKLEAVLKNL